MVLENIVRRLEMGEKPLRAALRGAREVGFTVISISLSLVAVFIPILFMGGVVGRLFREFSVVLATAVLVSMVVSLTTTPMMCATLLRPFDEELARRSARLRAEEGGRQGIFTHVGRLWGRFLSAMAGTHAGKGEKTAYILGGETVVHLTGHGLGGRNQELALAAAEGLAGLEAVVASVGSDGTDGPTDAAGGITDGATADALAALGISIDKTLADNDAYHALKACGGLILSLIHI